MTSLCACEYNASRLSYFRLSRVLFTIRERLFQEDNTMLIALAQPNPVAGALRQNAARIKNFFRKRGKMGPGW